MPFTLGLERVREAWALVEGNSAGTSRVAFEMSRTDAMALVGKAYLDWVPDVFTICLKGHKVMGCLAEGNGFGVGPSILNVKVSRELRLDCW